MQRTAQPQVDEPLDSSQEQLLELYFACVYKWVHKWLQIELKGHRGGGQKGLPANSSLFTVCMASLN